MKVKPLPSKATHNNDKTTRSPRPALKGVSVGGRPSSIEISPLTENEKRVLGFIESALIRTGHSPSYQEICNEFGFASYNSVQNYVKQLTKKGYLKVHPNQKRALEVLRSATAFQSQVLEKVSATTGSPGEMLLQAPLGIRPIPLLGRVAAGTPIERLLANETLEAPPALLKDPDQSYALQVEGQSMIDEGIHDGDWIVVLKKEGAKNGDLVVAVVDGSVGPEATVKRIYFHPRNSTEKRIELRPSNSQLTSQWFPESRVQIRGHVTGLLRKF
jgi:repressor LexA